MKKILVTSVILLCICFQALAQEAGRISMTMNNVSIEKVLDHIEKESGYSFSYSKTVVDLSPVVSVDVKDASIDEVLARIFSGTDITYSKTDGQIILSNKKDIASGDSKKELAPIKCKVKGFVKDSEGKPLMGAAVMVPGTSVASVTDFDGAYEITVDSGSLLEFAMLGFES